MSYDSASSTFHHTRPFSSQGHALTSTLTIPEPQPAHRMVGAPSASPDEAILAEVLGPEALAKTDLFDRDQLAAVVRICRTSESASDAGRRLFAISRGKRKVTNDADRLRKYLARFGLD